MNLKHYLRQCRHAVLCCLTLFLFCPTSFAASDADGEPEKPEIVIALPQLSGAPVPVFLAHEVGLFKKFGLNAKIQVLNSAVSVQAVVSGDAGVFAGGATLSSYDD